MASPCAAPQPHIPAWKKLGLKLKYAKDDASPTFQPLPKIDTINEKKRKHTSDAVTEVTSSTLDPATTKPSKKNKTSHLKSTAPSKIRNGEASHIVASLKPASSPKAPLPESSPPPSTPALTKRKSVSFTPETKASDGQSSKDLYTQWLATQKIDDPAFEPPKGQAALRFISPQSATLPQADSSISSQSSKPPKKTKATKKTKQKTEPQPANATPALAYLTAFTASPGTWKFSKNHQTHLLKHLFDLSTIPPSHTPALKTYLHGLKSPVARQRIREQALAVRAEEEMWFSELIATDTDTDKKRRREAYEEAWRREGERVEDAEDAREEREEGGEKWVYKGVGLSDWERNVAKRRRAEELIWAVGEGEVEALLPGIRSAADGGEDVTNGRGPGQELRAVGAKGKRKRVRKRRTTGVPDDESSSSSSSSSESSGDEEGKTNGERVGKGQPGSEKALDLSNGEESTSSSGSSSSGSSDDSE